MMYNILLAAGLRPRLSAREPTALSGVSVLRHDFVRWFNAYREEFPFQVVPVAHYHSCFSHAWDDRAFNTLVIVCLFEIRGPAFHSNDGIVQLRRSLWKPGSVGHFADVRETVARIGRFSLDNIVTHDRISIRSMELRIASLGLSTINRGSLGRWTCLETMGTYVNSKNGYMNLW
jgi:hypothetical protein